MVRKNGTQKELHNLHERVVGAPAGNAWLKPKSGFIRILDGPPLAVDLARPCPHKGGGRIEPAERDHRPPPKWWREIMGRSRGWELEGRSRRMRA